jgi:hypothetical protein
MSNQENAQPLIGSIAVAVGGKIIGKVFDKALEKALDKGMDKVVKRGDNPVQAIDKAPIKEEIRQEVVNELGPLVENLSNSEPLWRSKVLWTSLGALSASLASIVDMYNNGTPDPMMNYVLAASAAVGSIGAIYSRVFPTKALGR